MNHRLYFLAVVLAIGFGGILLRLGWWQLVQGSELAARADLQHFDSLEMPGKRGQILASDGTVLAGSDTYYLLYVYKPNFEADPDDLSEKLVELLYGPEDGEIRATESAQEREDLKLRLTRESVWEPLVKSIDSETKAAVESWDVAGLGFGPLSARYYPDASMSAHTLGFVGSDAAGRPTGYFGVEGFYDRELRGLPGFMRQEKDVAGNPILVGSFQEMPSTEGRSVVLHLDRFVQSMVESELKSALALYGAAGGEVVVMDPKTGAVLASASYPNYDPGSFSDFDPEVYRNPIVSSGYEPGSTFKVLVMAAALNEGVVGPETKCDICDGPIRIGKYSIRTWNGQYRPGITMTDVIVNSDNTGMVFVGGKLGERKMREYLRKFGIGQLTGVDLQEETTPGLREKWGEIDVATASFGQGVAVTTLQMLRAVAAIANDGVLMTPKVAAAIVGPDGEVEIEAKRAGRVVSKGAADEVTEMMVKAVAEGEAKFAAPKGYRIAGKTGTAQIPVAGHYDAEKTITSFVGFAPADEPKFVMLTKLNEPTSSPWGSETAAPLWFSIAKKLFTYWGIPPTR